MTDPPSGAVTFLFTDIEGSTRLWAEHGDVMGLALARHDEIVRSAVAEHDGYVFATAGDSFGIAFDRPAAALEFASDAQQRMGEEIWPEPLAIRVRIGMHTGEAEERGGDYFGSAVNLAARIEAAGHGGQVLVSSTSAELLSGAELVELGSFSLKDVVAVQRIFQFGRNSFPPLRTAGTRRGNLPRQRGRLVGRSESLGQLEATMAMSVLTTLVGPGGIGKTRIAVETARRVESRYRDGAWLIELAALGDSRAVVRTAADVLGVREAGNRTLLENVTRFLDTKHCLLVLDNCEHVIDGAAELADAIVDRCSGATVLATSREGLAVDGEVVMTVTPLNDLEAAVELFAERAMAADLSFDIEPHRAVVEEVCQRLDGVPLAIELAAALVRTLSPSDLATRLDDRFRLLTGGRRSSVERHRTLRATLDWSFDLLDDAEQALFQRLCVFAGWFDVAAAEAVSAGDRFDEIEVDDLLGSLVDRSMILSEPGPFGRRFRLLETMRQYGLERLSADGETDRTGRGHAEYYAAYLAKVAALLSSTAEIEGVVRLNEAWDNMRAAHAWACAAEDVDLAISLVLPMGLELYWRNRVEIGDWAERTLHIPAAAIHPLHHELVYTATSRYRWTSDGAGFEDIAERFNIAEHPGIVWNRAYLDSDWVRVVELASAAAAASRANGLDYVATGVSLLTANAVLQLGQIDEFDRIMAEHISTFESAGPPTALSMCLFGMALSASILGDSDRSLELQDRMLAVELPPDTWSPSVTLGAIRLFEHGNRTEAFTMLASALRDLLDTESMYWASLFTRNFVSIMIRLDRPHDVARIHGFRDSCGFTLEAGHPLTLEVANYLDERLNDQLAQEQARGSKLSTQDAMSYMLSTYDELASSGSTR